MALTITVTESATNAVNGLIIVPVVLTGAAVKASQTATPKFVNATATPFMDQSVTTTVTGSRVFGVITDGSNDNAVTADARTTILENFEDTVQAASYNAWRATALTTTPGATTLGFSSPSGDNAIYGALEILPNGTLTIDASTPTPFTTNAAQTGTTASFTPPAGSLIVLLVGHCSSGVSPVPTITNTGSLTFTQAPGGTSWLSESFGTAVGIFLADVPGGGAAVATPQPLIVPQAAVLRATDW